MNLLNPLHLLFRQNYPQSGSFLLRDVALAMPCRNKTTILSGYLYRQNSKEDIQ